MATLFLLHLNLLYRENALQSSCLYQLLAAFGRATDYFTLHWLEFRLHANCRENSLGVGLRLWFGTRCFMLHDHRAVLLHAVDDHCSLVCYGRAIKLGRPNFLAHCYL